MKDNQSFSEFLYGDGPVMKVQEQISQALSEMRCEEHDSKPDYIMHFDAHQLKFNTVSYCCLKFDKEIKNVVKDIISKAPQP